MLLVPKGRKDGTLAIGRLGAPQMEWSLRASGSFLVYTFNRFIDYARASPALEASGQNAAHR